MRQRIILVLLVVFAGLGIVLVWPRAVLLGLVIISLPLQYFYAKAYPLFMRHFAELNNMSYVESQTYKFPDGAEALIWNVIVGNWNGFPVMIYNTGHVNEKRPPYTVMEITIQEVKFPYIALQSKKMDRQFNTGGVENININNGAFMLSAARGYETEALQIFSPELLDYLTQKAKDFSIQFSEDKLNIYFNKEISTKKNLTRFLDVGKHIIDSSGAFMARLSDDFAVLHPYYMDKV